MPFYATKLLPSLVVSYGSLLIDTSLFNNCTNYPACYKQRYA